ncbi:homoserine dehydrogenase [Laceyella putida]|uniref:Homoserine dehydrogenase n=1 Tax=Laceyella putida TaxID=110101 RepID=A0ABW2RJU2_9BACL
MKQVRVALLGLGTVGTGVWKMIQSNQDVIARRTGMLVTVEAILVRNIHKDRQLEGVQALLTSRFEDVLAREIDVVIEVMGGVEPTRTYLRQAMEKGCHIVSANKELLARHGEELREWAKRHGVQLSYEASVGGGIPIIGTVSHFLKANRIYKVSGILNGTTNFILTKMKEEGRTYEDVLSEAQQKGYAEADPTADVEGIDAAHKLSILSRLSFDVCVTVDEIQRQGITDVTPVELSLAHQLGFAIKLLASAEQFGENGPVACCVYPTLLPLNHPLASVNDVYNAVHVEGDFIQDLTLIGQGAGEKPTASAVVEDLCNLGRVSGQSLTKAVRCPLLDGASEGGLRFHFLEISSLQGSATKAIERLKKAGVAVYAWETKREEETTWLAFIARGLEKDGESELFKELGWQTTRVINRPVLGGEALFAADVVPFAKAAAGVK